MNLFQLVWMICCLLPLVLKIRQVTTVKNLVKAVKDQGISLEDREVILHQLKGLQLEQEQKMGRVALIYLLVIGADQVVVIQHLAPEVYGGMLKR